MYTNVRRATIRNLVSIPIKYTSEKAFQDKGLEFVSNNLI